MTSITATLRAWRQRAANPVVAAALARALTLLPSAVATLLVSRLLVTHYGLGVFNGFTLVVATMLLVPLNSLGTGTAVTSSFATCGPDDPRTDGVTLTAARTMAVASIVVATASLALGVFGWWTELVGSAATSGLAFGVSIALFSASFVPALGQSMLLGINRSHLNTLVQSTLAPAMVVLVGIAIALGAGSATVFVIPGAAALLVALANAWLAGRITRFDWRSLIARLPRRARYPGSAIRSLAIPAAIVNLAAPAMLSSDRLVLSHVSSTKALAAYSVTWQIFAPVMALIVAAAQPLWPAYAAARVEGRRGPSMARVQAMFCGLAFLACAVLVPIAGPVGRLIGAGEVPVGLALPATMAAFVVGYACVIPLSMALMDEAGLRLSATCAVIALPLNLIASITLARALGAPGPLLGSMAVGVVVQIIPAFVHLRRRNRRLGSIIPAPAVVATAAGPDLLAP